MMFFRGSSCTLCSILLLVSEIQSLSDLANDRALELEKLPDDASDRDGLRHSTRIRTRNNSPALNHFLEDVLNAQNELKWIDQAVHRSANRRNVGTLARRQNQDENMGETFGKRGSFVDDDLKTKRGIENEIKTENSHPSLASLKRTIIELSNSLNPHDIERSKIHRDEETSFDSRRKLLSSQNVRSAMGIAIEYYDYEEDNGPVAAIINQPAGREIEVLNPPDAVAPGTAENTVSGKKDEHAVEEKEEELRVQNLKNKVPKEEFISNVQDSSRGEEESRPSSSNALYNSPVLRKISADDASESSDESRWETARSRDTRNSDHENSSVESKIVDFYVRSEPEFLQKRTYLLMSPSNEKKTKKRSVNMHENEEERRTQSKLNSDADKSARNYAALKSTDDMFKGGVEQSNPLGEDKPNLLESSSFPVFSTLVNSSRLFKSFKTKTTTSPEWKVFRVNSKEKLKHESSIRGIGRHLTQITYEIPIDNSSISTFFVPSSTDKYVNNTILMSDSPVTTNIIMKNSSISESTISTLATSIETEIHNNTRLRRHAESFSRENVKPRKHRAHRRRKHRVNPSGKKRHSDSGDSQQRKLTLLLAADNIDDESQIDLAVHGELAGKIVEKIFEQVQQNEGLKVALGPGLYRKHKPQQSHKALDKTNRDGLDKEEVKETEAMMKRVMELLGRLVFDEVRRRTCASLPPDLREFLQWAVGLDEMAEPLSDQVPPLPGIPGGKKPDDKSPNSANKFLFPNSEDNAESNGLNELARKVNLLRGLINEYNALTEREKTKVHTVHDYLLRQLTLLLKFIESKEAAEGKPGGVPKSDGETSAPQILQYAASLSNQNITKIMHNSTNASALNSSTDHQHAYSMFNARPVVLPYLNHYSRASDKRAGLSYERKKRRSENFDFSEQLKNADYPRNIKTNESVEEYHKLLSQIATLRRKKRAYYLGYETPKIFIEPDESNATMSQISSTFWTTNRPQESSFLPNISSLNLSIPVRGKNRVEDEVLLLNKREAWKKENQLLLEEVAFGKDTRNDLVPEIISNEIREKRAYDEKIKTNVNKSMKSTKNPIDKFPNYSSRLRENLIEKSINVFPVAETTESRRSSDAYESRNF